MPLYEYVCQDCENRAELLIRGNELPSCPSCGSSQMLKQLSVVAAPVTPSGASQPSPRAGGCGGSCACHPH